MITPSLNASDVSRTFRVLRKLDPDSVKVLRKDLRSKLVDVAKDVAKEYPSSPPLSGFMQTFGRWGWGRVVGKVSVTPGKSRRGAGAKNVVSLQMTYNNATPWVMEMIGSQGGAKIGRYDRQKSRYKPPYGQGPALLRAVNSRFPAWPKGGRVFYKVFLTKRKEVISEATDVIESWSEEVTRKLK
jgi:hypothetical protein